MSPILAYFRQWRQFEVNWKSNKLTDDLSTKEENYLTSSIAMHFLAKNVVGIVLLLCYIYLVTVCAF